MENYVMVNGRKYRKGHTTGACAAAASKAAAAMLVSGQALKQISIDTPAGVKLHLPVLDIELGKESAKCAVIKDGGDDPDVTTGLKIFAEARFAGETGVRITAGEGIGTVTMPGLKVAPGQPAINPVPMRMILKEVAEVLPEDKSVEIMLTVPGGEEIAKKTYNARLGITGGISILGTTGIVHPMSEEAWKESLALELKVMAVGGLKNAVYIFGNYGEEFVASQLGVAPQSIIKTSNFVGFMLEKAVENRLESVLIAGHLGKLVKVAGGIFHTHSKVADARMEILTAYAALEGASHAETAEIYACRTTEAAAAVIDGKGLKKVYDRIVSNVSKRCSEYVFHKIRVGSVLFNSENVMLAMDDNAREILKLLRDYENGK